MQRRTFLRRTTNSLVATATAAAGLTLGACSTAVTPTTSAGRDTAQGPAQKHREIDSNVDAALARLGSTVPATRELLGKAAGVLVFPNVIAAGLVVGGEYGEGALRVRGSTAQYYSMVSGSFGLQIGAQSKAVVFLFMTQDALAKFRASNGWSVGADASVALLKVGANGNLEMTGLSSPVLAFVMTNAGLMANLTLEGSKITPLKN